MNRSQKKLILLAGAIFLITLVAYVPVMRGGFIWDDNDYITDNLALRTLDGLGRIWLEPGAVPQYYPMVFTTFWVEYHLWQLHPLGYHLVNVLLHALNGVLLLLVLRYLRVPGAWLAAAIFTLHPVHVESVAWITERKNVLSGIFYLSSLLAYLHFANLNLDPANGSPSTSAPDSISPTSKYHMLFYALSLLLFLFALLSKTVTCSLPAAILLLLWWKRARLRWQDILALLPFFIMGVALGLITVWMEKVHVGAQGEEWMFSFVERCLIAGRAVWFYASKLVWPHNLIFIYPQWQIDPDIWWQYILPLSVLGIIFTLWWLRPRIGKAPFAAAVFFVGTLLPALGFFDVYPMRYSFVADHFQYLASIGLITLGSAALTTFLIEAARWRGYTGLVLCLALLLFLGVRVWQQGTIYRDAETLYQHTISRNPRATMAHNNLGVVLMERGRLNEAIAHFSQAVKINPNFAELQNNLGFALVWRGKINKAQFHLCQALRINPNYAEAHNNLGIALAGQGSLERASNHFLKALQLKPNFAEPHFNLGNALARQGKYETAVDHFSRALQLKPDLAEAHNSLGVVLTQEGRLDEAVFHFAEALRLKPGYQQAQNNLRISLEKTRKLDQVRKNTNKP